eukprot:Rmarinus@m.13002
MKALILVGGYGTRLRPLTLSTPKPLVEFCNKAMIMHQIEALKMAGVNEVVLAINYQPQVMKDFLANEEKKLGIKITCSQETVPLGTAGPLALAKDILNDGSPFFVLNSDVACSYPLKDLLKFHQAHGKTGTILVTRVEEPSKYGVVVMDQKGQIQHFVEKPQTFVGNKINAGIYILNPEILNRIEPKPTSIEKEVFPALADEGELYAMTLEGFWMDVGQPRDYLSGAGMMLQHYRKTNADVLASGPHITGNVLIHETAKIGEGVSLGPDLVIGPNCVVGDGARLARSTLFSDVTVGKHAFVKNSIVGWKSRIGAWARTENVSVLGEDVEIKDEVYVNGGIILPHKSVGNNIQEPKIVM